MSNYTLMVEPRLTTPFPHTYGRVDLLVLGEGKDYAHKALIFDWKDGWNYQGDAKTNLQIWGYVLGVWHRFPWVKEITGYFFYTQRDEITKAHFVKDRDYDDICNRVRDINARYKAAEDGEALHARNQFCEYCMFQHHCPEWLPDIEAALVGHSDTPSKRLPSTWNLNELATRPDDMSKVLAIGEAAIKYFEEAKKLAKVMIEDEELDIPGYRTVQSNSGISADDVEGLYQTCEEVGLPIDIFLSHVSTVYVGKLITDLAAHTHKKLNLSFAKAKVHWREELLKTGLIKEGTPYNQLRKETNA